MGKRLLMMLAACAVALPAGAQAPTPEDEVFGQGMSAGHIQAQEGKVTDAYLGLLALEKVAGAEEYRKVLVVQLNTALFALSFVDRDVKMRPGILRQLAALSSANMKTAMANLRRARVAKNWLSADPKQEERIAWVLDRYEKTGNAYGFE